jgi:hypothetical protein
VLLNRKEGRKRESTSKIEVSLATERRSEPTKASPAPVVSTTFTENPGTLPLKLCALQKTYYQTMRRKWKYLRI